MWSIIACVILVDGISLNDFEANFFLFVEFDVVNKEMEISWVAISSEFIKMKGGIGD